MMDDVCHNIGHTSRNAQAHELSYRMWSTVGNAVEHVELAAPRWSGLPNGCGCARLAVDPDLNASGTGSIR